MFSKKQLVTISFLFALIFHFGFHFYVYGSPIKRVLFYMFFLLAFLSIIIMIFLYLGTYWRHGQQYKKTILIYDLLVLWIFICLIRSLVELRSMSDLKPFFFDNYMAISLFPVLFFTVGINSKYFLMINKVLFWYIVLAALFSFAYFNYLELQIFVLMPIFYIILTIPQQTSWKKLIILIISISVILVSFSNRAGILRILISFSIVAAYYLMRSNNINRKLVNFLAVLVLFIPLISIYLGFQGQSVFQLTMGDDYSGSGQFNPYADTRTFLYYEVFQDITLNNSLLIGKGLNAGYTSEVFETYSRLIVEVGFLQIILKTGIVGFILYLSVIISSINNALGRSKSLFMKSMGLVLVGYTLLIFIENVIAYNMLNIMIWIIIGMCHSVPLLKLNDRDFINLIQKGNI